MILPLAFAQKITLGHSCGDRLSRTLSRVAAPGDLGNAPKFLPHRLLDPAKQDHTATWAMGSRKITSGNRLSDTNRSSQVASNGAGVSSCFRFRVGVSGPIFSLRLRLRNMCHIT